MIVRTAFASLVAAALGAAALALAPTAAPSPAAQASEKSVMTFDFKDPKGVNGLMFMLDSTLEPFFGTGTSIAGEIRFDPADPTTAAGTLTMQARSLSMTNSRMTSVLHGADWLDVEQHPEISVVIEKVADAKKLAENDYQLQATVAVSIKGSSRSMTIPVRATYLPGRLGDRVRGMQGDLLVLRSSFVVKRSDFGIKLDSSTEVVADDIQITAAITGFRAG